MSMSAMSRWWGPVFDAERTTRARRWQGYALRSLFVLGLLGGLAMVWLEQSGQNGTISVRQMAAVGMAAFYILTFIQLMAVLLVAPAATAGAICIDKSRGALAHIFVTDLTDPEIILGKLAARLLPVWGLLACALPVAAATTLLGGIDPMALTGVFIIAVGVAWLGCSVALLLSVWAGKTHEVLSTIFGVWVVWVLACPLYQGYLRGATPPNWLRWSNPFYLAYAPYNYPGATSLVEPGLFALGCLVLGAGCVAVAVAKVRVVGCRSARVRSGKKKGWLGRVRGESLGRWGPTLDRDPILWREWHRNRPSRWTRLVWTGFGAMSTAAGCLMIYSLLKEQLTPNTWEWHGLILGLIVIVGLLLVSTSTASVLAEERARGSLDVLMSTPVSTRAILRAKWWGAFRRIPWLIFWPTLIGMITCIAADMDRLGMAILGLVPLLILVQGGMLVSLGLALATWIKRTGQATAWTIAALLAAGFGLAILGELLPLNRLIVRQTGPNGQYLVTVRNVLVELSLAMGSPFVNVAGAYMESVRKFSGSEQRRQAVLILMVAWSLVYGLGAWLLFELTVLTFNRCLGRVSERPSAPRREPVGGPRPRYWGVRGWGWKIPGAASRPVGRAASCGPPPR